jgi:hypothetical protein
LTRFCQYIGARPSRSSRKDYGNDFSAIYGITVSRLQCDAGTRMAAPWDVFSVKQGQEPKWLGSTESLAEAVELIRGSGAGSYVVFSQQTGNKNFFEVSPAGVVSPGSTWE